MSLGLAEKRLKNIVKREHASAEPTHSLLRNSEKHFSKFWVLIP